MQPLIWLKLFLRGKKAPDYRKRWAERYGFCRNKVKPNGILIHTVSMGETIAAVPLIQTLLTQFPHLPITVTTMTPTGSNYVTKHLKNSVSHVYLPYDLPCAIRRFLNTMKPKIVIIMETELWPNLITALHKKQIPLIIANARLSARSAKGYARFAKSTQKMLSQITHIAAQDHASAERFLKLGLREDQLSVTGSIKYDISLSDAIKTQSEHLRQSWAQNRLVWIAASTHEGEETILLNAHRHLLETFPDLLLILVPRHPERFKTVENQLINAHFSYVKRSENTAPENATQVVLGDSMGELLTLFGVADIAFIGGSLVPRGGHNPLEAALHHLPILMGKHVFNFHIICDELAKKQGLIFVDDATLTQTIQSLLEHPSKRQIYGENAFNVLKSNQGALNRLLEKLQRYLI